MSSLYSNCLESCIKSVYKSVFLNLVSLATVQLSFSFLEMFSRLWSGYSDNGTMKRLRYRQFKQQEQTSTEKLKFKLEDAVSEHDILAQ